MFAVLKTGGKQYKVSKNDVIIVEKLTAVAGDVIQFDHILMVGDDKVQIGDPTINGAAVHGEVIEQTKNKKVISFVKRRRKHSSQRTKGHRQNVTVLRVKEILTSGAKTVGTQIEVGVKVIGSNPIDLKKPVAKTEAAKKPVAKTEAAKKLVAKTEAAKKPVAKTEAAKKPVVKIDAAKKPVVKADAAKKPVAKTKVVKKPTAKIKKS